MFKFLELLLLLPPPLLQEENERLEMMWLQVDEDRNGTLDRSEVAAVLKKMGLSADDEDVEEGDRTDGMLERQDDVEEDEQPEARWGAVEEASQPRRSSPRLTSLDTARGLTIALMIAVDNMGDSWPHIDHSPWNGIRLADFVMPSFDVIVGVAVAFSMKQVPRYA